MKVDPVSKLPIKEPFFSILTPERKVDWLMRGFLCIPKIKLYLHQWGFGLYIPGSNPWFSVEVCWADRKGDIGIKLGRTLHHIFHDLRAQGFLGFFKHIRENW